MPSNLANAITFVAHLLRSAFRKPRKALTPEASSKNCGPKWLHSLLGMLLIFAGLAAIDGRPARWLRARLA